MKVMEPQEINTAFEEAYNSGEIERIMALCEPDAKWHPVREDALGKPRSVRFSCGFSQSMGDWKSMELSSAIAAMLGCCHL